MSTAGKCRCRQATAICTSRQSQRVVRFEFAALDFAAPDHNEFSYKLWGFDDDWVKAGTRHDATYTNLPPGDYCLEVRGANHDGTWNERTATVGLVVDAPWWATRLMYALYAALALLLIERLRYLYTHRRRAELAHNTAIMERENRLRLALWGSGDEFWDWDLRRNEIRMTGVDAADRRGAGRPRRTGQRLDQRSRASRTTAPSSPSA